MVWSYSSSRSFARCQRQWFIKQYIANPIAKDPARRNAYLLSTLQSPYAWRGSLVDTVISQVFIPALIKKNTMPSELDLVREARILFDKQLTFALDNRMRENGMSKKQAGDSYAALHPVEYEEDITETMKQQLWNEIEQSLVNFRTSYELMKLILPAKWWAAQRPLTFSCEGINVQMVPDLIVFYDNQKPLIIDWKVHYSGEHNARRQLASYALALVSCKPHRDFPLYLKTMPATEVRLLEVQLLTQKHRSYVLTETDVELAISYIVRSHAEMELATDGNPQSLTMSDLPVTNNPDTCQHCNFRSICWNQEQDS